MTSVFVGSPKSRRTRRGFATVAGVLAAVLVLSGCSAEEPVEERPAPKDLTLTIGALVPESGALDKFGPAVSAAIALAAQDVNDANAKLVVNVETSDSGDSSDSTPEDAATELLDAGATVIIGGLSNGISKKVVDMITAAGVVEISPANDSPDFSNYDDSQLYWRTSPSCALEGSALGAAMAERVDGSIAILSEDALCGPLLPRAVSETFLRGGGEVIYQETINDKATGLTDTIDAAIEAKPDAVAIVGSKQAEKIAKAFIKAGYSGDQLFFTGLSLGDRDSDFTKGALTDSIVTQPGLDIDTITDFTDRLLEIDPSLKDFSYAAESYDAVILASLAALVSQDTSGTAIASALQEVSGGSGDGEVALNFADAAKIVLDGRTVDYDGVSGPITLSDNGDPQGAIIGIYQYGSDNVYTRIG
ncbi:ABC transporter substrate-binding protein [Salinibacterium sp. SWN1162]|uniref:ABC transporter substrate-binding protein n=1 Tax=Salinibacterium sp. SWN1162 TaxID=2792053 RepID=UPI0018CE1F25|nr:ABC transporter substrate-binding protein [Salinibacterium sp. SWN1162]MBH0008509.1 ABC transporter substrate-binding protein [Salinibacterium sp. SWN1162]